MIVERAITSTQMKFGGSSRVLPRGGRHEHRRCQVSELLTLFTRAHNLLRAAADEAMSRHGVRVGQNLVLAVLWETDGLTPGELAGRLHLTTPTIVNTATRKEEASLLTR